MHDRATLAIEHSTKRQHFTDVRHVTVRWEPYKPDGARQMKALGRWQEQVGSGDYWRWQNCDRPAFAHDPDLAQKVEALTAENAALRAQVDAAQLALTIDPWLLGYTGWKIHVDETVRALAQQEGAKG